MKNKLTMEEIEILLQRNIEMLQTCKKINQLKESIKKKLIVTNFIRYMKKHN